MTYEETIAKGTRYVAMFRAAISDEDIARLAYAAQAALGIRRDAAPGPVTRRAAEEAGDELPAFKVEAPPPMLPEALEQYDVRVGTTEDEGVFVVSIQEPTDEV